MKERIIGAVVLVVFVVLVVPIFLDGPAGDSELVSQRVLLPGQEEQGVTTVVLDRERSAPIPMPSTASTPTTASTNESVQKPAQPAVEREVEVATPQPEPVAEQVARVDEKPDETKPENVTQPVLSSTGMWAVQLGSFSNKENAEKLAASLRKQGYAAFLSQLKSASGTLHRVRIGPQKDRESAEAMAVRLLKVNHKGQVVPHP